MTFKDNFNRIVVWMRLFLVLFGFLISAPALATEVSEDATNEKPAVLEPEITKPIASETPLWEFDYERGRNTARLGTQMGTAGVIAIVTGIGLIGAGIANGQEGFESFSENWMPLSGMMLGFTGILAVQVGAPVAAMGTAKSHRALVDGRQADRGCGSCVLAVVLSVPNPLSLISLPVSYTVSSSQRRSDQLRYHRYKGFSSPKVKMSRRGVGLSWQF